MSRRTRSNVEAGMAEILEENTPHGIVKIYTNTCPICNSQTLVKISDANANFLRDREAEGNLDEAISLSRICWNSFPALRLSTDSKAIIEEFLESTKHWLEKQTEEVLRPITELNGALTSTVSGLSTLSQSLPEGLKPHLNAAIGQLDGKIQLAETDLKGTLLNLQSGVEAIRQQLAKVTYNPSSKGDVGETSIVSVWSETFPRDLVTPKGGAGASDLLVEPYLGDGEDGHLGTLISVERKAGKQRYASTHLHKAIQHAKREGARYAVLIYDSCENLIHKPLHLDRINGVFYVACEFETGSWKVARELIGLLQEGEQKPGGQEVDLEKIRTTVEDMAEIEAAKDSIQRDNEKAWKANDNIRQKHLPALDDALREYRTRLQHLIDGE